MKKIIVFGLLGISFLSCEKTQDVASTEQFRLTTTKAYDDDHNPYTTTISYDATGRIVKVLNTLDPQDAIVQADVTYSGSETIVNMVAPVGYDQDMQIKFTLDGQGKPVKRVKSTIINFDNTDFRKRQVKRDTTWYEYNADGLLSLSTQNEFDSIWYNSGGSLDSSFEVKRSNTHYTNANKNLVSSETTSIIKVDAISQDIVTTNEYSGTTNNSYEYDKNYSNKVDFKNAYLLSEFYLLTWHNYPINKGYANFPNKISEISIGVDESGAEIYNEEYISSLEVKFNESGLISYINEDASAYPTEFIYSK